MILITDSFKKLLWKIKSVWIENIKIEIWKHKSGNNNFIENWYIRERKVLKWYLLSKKIRLLILFQEKNWKYLPFYVVKKETKDGWNITKDSLQDLEDKLDKIFKDLETGRFEIIE